jgi:double zinc ribbon protein
VITSNAPSISGTEFVVDELDRMYRRMVQNVRAGFPDLLARPFEVSQIYQHIIPYRLNRREMAIESNEAYELTLMQLLSGARALVTGDDEMQRALRAELESPNPDLTAFRAYATSLVALDPEALRALDAQPAMRSPSPIPAAAASTHGAKTRQAEAASRATEEVSVAGSRAAAEASAPARSSTRTSAPKRVPATPSRPTPVGCRYCGGELPDSRELTFCPHCGQNLSVKQCPACNTELELDWRFCITCGRESD